MQDPNEGPPTAESLGISADVATWTPAEKRTYNDASREWLDAQCEPPAGGGVEIGDLTVGSPTYGGTAIHTPDDLAAEEAFDRARPGSAEAIEAEVRTRAAARRHMTEMRATTRERYEPALEAITPTSTTCSRQTRIRITARSGLRSGRPSCSSSRRTTSRSSSSSGDDSSGEPEPPRAAVLTYAVLPREAWS